MFDDAARSSFPIGHARRSNLAFAEVASTGVSALMLGAGIWWSDATLVSDHPSGRPHRQRPRLQADHAVNLYAALLLHISHRSGRERAEVPVDYKWGRAPRHLV